VLEALLWGAFASSSLVIGAVVAMRVPVSRLVLGLVLGFGAGVLLSALAFEKGGRWVGVVATRGFATAFE
jgi:ZIP family zinc transporter